ncbi:MAG: efflux RND transporter periplasmic adaptor subunit [Selenomonadaceae bacterium]|nr:efflux RND transporter periplasmic adaptor subunit [Selenomonadaceae bacterium]
MRRGENLLKVDTDELENNLRLAKSDLKKATVNNENVKANYNRKRKLFDVGAISKETLELAAVQLKTSIAETEDAETKMQIAQKKLFDAMVTSPVNGVIANKKVNVGQIVSAGSQLMTVEEIDSVYVTVKVEQQFISEVQIGTNAQIKTDAFPDKNFTGKVAVINPVAGAESRLFEVKISVDNPDFILMPGMFTEVLIDEDKKSIMLTVPRSAVISRKGQNYVYVLDKNSDTVKRQRVEIGELLDENIEIISGISEGDEIVTDNIDKLKDGDAVNVYGGGGN